jgi:hypothetical protein
MEYLLARPEIGYVLTHLQPLLAEGVTWPKALNRAYYDTHPPGYLPSALLVRRSAWARVGSFDRRLKLGSDGDWFFRARQASVPMGIIPRALVHWRIHPANQSSNTGAASRELLAVVREHLARRGKIGDNH